jgi:hypothetical protein
MKMHTKKRGELSDIYQNFFHLIFKKIAERLESRGIKVKVK